MRVPFSTTLLCASSSRNTRALPIDAAVKLAIRRCQRALEFGLSPAACFSCAGCSNHDCTARSHHPSPSARALPLECAALAAALEIQLQIGDACVLGYSLCCVSGWWWWWWWSGVWGYQGGGADAYSTCAGMSITFCLLRARLRLRPTRPPAPKPTLHMS